ncbi:MAG: hypothetical protein Q4C46_12130 [Bacillota bacterium]|nr:hypothetical protein [Bacillota bacterium]
MKKIVSFVVIMCLVLALVPITTEKAEAATYTIKPGVSEISGTAYLTIYNSLSNKNYKVVKVNGAYYVQFKYGNNVVKVKWPTACPTKNVNDFSYTNQKIGKAISGRTNYDGGEVFQKNMNYSDGYRSYDKWSMVYLQASGSYSSGKIVLKCKNLSGLRITFATKYKYGSVYRTPKTCAEYMKCLQIVKDSNAIEVTPKWDVQVVKPGKNKNVLSTYKVAGLGYATRTNDIDRLFNVYYTTKAIATSTVPALSVKNLYDLYRQGADLQGSNSTGYNTGETFLLSKNNGSKYYKCMRATFTAPLKLTKAKNFYEVDVYLNKSISSGSPYTSIKTTLSIPSCKQK